MIKVANLFSEKNKLEKKLENKVEKAVESGSEGSAKNHFKYSLWEKKLRDKIFLYRQNLQDDSLNKEWGGRRLVTGSYVLKRMVDIVVAFSLIVILSPVFLIIITLIRAESYGCAFYGEKRVGRDGEIFRLYQFRTLYARIPQYNFLRFFVEEAGGTERVLLKINENRNITKVGKWLYVFSLERLPELFNILLGDMSLMGPRPWTENELRSYSLSHRIQLHLKPGLAFLGNRHKVCDYAEEALAFQDVEYLDQLSWMQQTFVLLKVSLLVFFGRAAY